MSTGEPKGVKQNLSIGKAFAIIEAMAEVDGPMRLQDIALRVRQHASTVLRFLTALSEIGYVAQDEQSLRYRLTPRFIRLGGLVTRQMNFREIAHPCLLELSRTHGESASLAVEQDLNVVYIDVVDGPDHMLQTLQRIGKIAPLHSTGVGKVLLAGFDDRRMEELLSARGLPSTTRKTIRSKRALLSEMERVRAAGYAVDYEECENGVRCIAAPIHDHSGAIIAACSVSGPSSRMSDEKIERVRDDLLRMTAGISSRLGYEKPDAHGA